MMTSAVGRCQRSTPPGGDVFIVLLIALGQALAVLYRRPAGHCYSHAARLGFVFIAVLAGCQADYRSRADDLPFVDLVSVSIAPL